MKEEELLLKCREFFTLGDDGLYYRIWRKGLNKSCVGKRAGNTHHSGYRYVKVNGKLYADHRIVWLMTYGRFPEKELDHINGDRHNSGINNLRESSRGENCSNRSGWSISGYKGVYQNKRGLQWRAQITVDKKIVRLGNFRCKIEAAKEYDKAALLYKGKFAKLNF